MSKTVKVKLKCNYGEKIPGQIVDMDEEKAKTFVGEGAGEYVTKDTTSKQEKALQTKIKGLEDSAVELNKTIEAQKETIKGLEDSATKIATLTKQLEEAITLPKGTAPDGYVKAE